MLIVVVSFSQTRESLLLTHGCMNERRIGEPG
jgi:hypothetical protein